MSPSPARLLSALLLIALMGSGALAEPRPAPEKPRLDALGDPLPDGAVMRLGSSRFRQAHYVEWLAYSPDGKLLAACGYDHVAVWEAETGRQLRSWPHHYAYALTFLADGKTLLVCGSGDAGDAYYDVATGKVVKPFGKKGMTTRSLALTADRKVLVAGSYNEGTIRVWDLVEGTVSASWKTGGKEGGSVPSVAVTPDGKRVAAAGEDQFVRVWETATGKEVQRFSDHGQSANSVAVSPDGKLLASGGWDSTVCLRELASGKLVRRLKGPPSGSVTRVAFSPDGKLLASAGGDRAVRLWDVDSGKPLHEFKGHLDAVQALAFSPDGKRLASGGADMAVRVWDVTTGKEASAHVGHQGEPHTMQFAHDGKTLATCGSDNTLRLWDVATGKERRAFDGELGLAALLHFTPDGKRLVTVSHGLVRVWDLASGKEERKLGYEEHYTGQGYSTLALSPDGKLVAGGGLYAGVIVWEVETGKKVHDFKGHMAPIRSIAFSPDGKYLLFTVAANADAILCDLTTGKEVYQLGKPPFCGNLHFVTFSPDGHTTALCGRGEGFWFWDAVERKERRASKASPQASFPVGGGAFSPDGRTFVTSNAGGYSSPPDGVVELWEVATGQRRAALPGHRGRLSAVAVSPDGTLLATGAVDTSVLLWDLTGRAKYGHLQKEGLKDEELKALWADLAGDDAAKAYEAILKLSAVSRQGVAFLEERLRPAKPERVGKLIADLDDDEAAVRERATKELESLGQGAGPALRAAQKKGAASTESATRLKVLLDLLDKPRERLRQMRAVEALERSGTAEARRVLEGLAKEMPAAKAALERLAKQAEKKP